MPITHAEFDAANDRRHELLNKQHDSSRPRPRLTPDEVAELDRLTQLCDDHLDQEFPLPKLSQEDLDTLDRIIQEDLASRRDRQGNEK